MRSRAEVKCHAHWWESWVAQLPCTVLKTGDEWILPLIHHQFHQQYACSPTGNVTIFLQVLLTNLQHAYTNTMYLVTLVSPSTPMSNHAFHHILLAHIVFIHIDIPQPSSFVIHCWPSGPKSYIDCNHAAQWLKIQCNWHYNKTFVLK